MWFFIFVWPCLKGLRLDNYNLCLSTILSDSITKNCGSVTTLFLQKLAEVPQYFWQALYVGFETKIFIKVTPRSFCSNSLRYQRIANCRRNIISVVSEKWQMAFAIM